MLMLEKTGTGPLLLFIHAFPFTRHMWEAQIAAFSPNYTVLTLDLPGFGDSPLVGGTSSMLLMAEEIKDTLAFHHISQKLTVIGLSMGGYVLFPLYRLLKDQIKGVVLASTRATADTDKARAGRFQTIQQIEKEGTRFLADKMIPQLFSSNASKSAVQDARSMILNNTPEGICAALRGMADRPDSTQTLHRIECPILVISGGADVLTPPDEVQNLAKGPQDASLVNIPGAGHMVNMEAPEAFNKALRTFLQNKAK